MHKGPCKLWPDTARQGVQGTAPALAAINRRLIHGWRSGSFRKSKHCEERKQAAIYHGTIPSSALLVHQDCAKWEGHAKSEPGMPHVSRATPQFPDLVSWASVSQMKLRVSSDSHVGEVACCLEAWCVAAGAIEVLFPSHAKLSQLWLRHWLVDCHTVMGSNRST